MDLFSFQPKYHTEMTVVELNKTNNNQKTHSSLFNQKVITNIFCLIYPYWIICCCLPHGCARAAIGLLSAK